MSLTIRKWLSNIYYNKEDQRIYSKNMEDKSQIILDVKGWGRLQNEFETEEEAAKFQDEIGEFVADAIRQKIMRLNK